MIFMIVIVFVLTCIAALDTYDSKSKRWVFWVLLGIVEIILTYFMLR